MTTTSQSVLAPIRALFRNPVIAFVAVVAYVFILSLILTRGLDTRNNLFPLLSMIFFPPLVLAPFLTLGTSIDSRLKLLIILVLLFAVMPVVGMYNRSYLEIAIQICIFACLALGLNIVVGFAGLLDLGYIAFFAVGAYLWAIFTSPVETYVKIQGWTVPGSYFYLFMILGVVMAAVVGIVLGLPVLRLRGDYLAIVTLGFGEMIRILAQNSDSVGNPPINLTNGSQGLDTVGSPQIPQLLRDLVTTIERALNLPLENVQPLTEQLLIYFIAIIAIVIIIIVARRLEDSPIGRAWTAIREDEVAAIAMGVPLVRMKLLAFAMGASFAGAIGVLYAAKQTFVSPESFSLIQSISILAMVIVGGIGSIRGVLLGASVVTLLNLQVLKNLSLQINAWRNNDAILPKAIIVIIAAIVLLILLRAAWRAWQRAMKERSDWGRYSGMALAGLFALIGVGIFVAALLGGDFHVRDWPSQLEPAKYERLVFGVLLILMMIFRPAGLLPENRRKMEMQESKAAGASIPQVSVGGD